MENKNWQNEAIEKSGVNVPEWELEPTRAEQKETMEASVESEPNVAEKRLEEIAAETKEISPENPEQKATQVETMRAEIAGMAPERPAEKTAPVEKQRVEKGEEGRQIEEILRKAMGNEAKGFDNMEGSFLDRAFDATGFSWKPDAKKTASENLRSYGSAKRIDRQDKPKKILLSLGGTASLGLSGSMAVAAMGGSAALAAGALLSGGVLAGAGIVGWAGAKIYNKFKDRQLENKYKKIRELEGYGSTDRHDWDPYR